MNETGNSQTSSLKALSQNERTGPQHLIFLISKKYFTEKKIFCGNGKEGHTGAPACGHATALVL
jgi:hypothetical protein